MQLLCSAGPCLLTRHVCQTLSRPARYHLPLRAVLFRLGLGPAWGMSPLRADDKVCEKSIYLKSDPLQRQDPKGGLARRLTEAPDECGSVLVANTSLPCCAAAISRPALCVPPTHQEALVLPESANVGPHRDRYSYPGMRFVAQSASARREICSAAV